MIVWDFGGVVAAFHPERRLAALTALTGLPPDVIHDRIWTAGLDAAAERGVIAATDLWPRVLAALDHRADRADVRAAWATAFEPNIEVLALIDSLDEPTALLTNNGPILHECLDHEFASVSSRFERRLFSHQLGAVKPQPSAFEEAVKQLERDHDELVLIDDNPANVEAAIALGWRAVLFTDAAPLRRSFLDLKCG